MKRLVCAALVLSLLLCACGGLAEGQLTVTKENFYVYKSSSSYYSYVYARVDNTGDAPIRVNSGTFQVFNTDGELLVDRNFVNSYAAYLAPGEYTYVSSYEKLEVEDPAVVGSYKLTVASKNDTSKTTLRLLSAPWWEPDVAVSKYTTYNYMNAVVTNQTDRTLFDLMVVLVLLDDEDNILYLYTDSMSTSKGLNPGSSITVKLSVPDYRMERIRELGLVPSRVEAIPYVLVNAE